MAVVGLVADLLAKGYLVRVQVAGESMAPTIRSGDTVTVEPIDPTRLRTGEIVVCRDGFGRIRMHRLIERVVVPVQLYVTRGDNRPACDPPQLPSEVLGRVVRIERCWRRRLMRTCQTLIPDRLRALVSHVVNEPR